MASDGIPPGLRERKKAKTRAAIQTHAVRLFEERGFAKTTIEQIAEAAEVSHSTLFRYFPTKKETVAHNAFTPAFLAAFRRQPLDMDVFDAVMAAMREAATEFDADSWNRERRRQKLVLAVPELRGASFEQLGALAASMNKEVAARVGRQPDDFHVRNFTGALLGVFAAVVVDGRTSIENYVGILEDGVTHLKSGLPL